MGVIGDTLPNDVGRHQNPGSGYGLGFPGVSAGVLGSSPSRAFLQGLELGWFFFLHAFVQ